MKDKKVFCIDFDGTLFEESPHTFPIPGAPKLDIIEACKKLKKAGNILILYTSREGYNLERGLQELKPFGLEFDYINENLPENIRRWGDSRKVIPDYYCDDRNISLNELITFANFTEVD